MFSDIFAITDIIKDQRHDNLSISINEAFKNDDPDNPIKTVLLYTPDMDNTNDHYHIELSFGEVVELHKWCEAYLKTGTFLHEKYKDDLKRNIERNKQKEKE